MVTSNLYKEDKKMKPAIAYKRLRMAVSLLTVLTLLFSLRLSSSLPTWAQGGDEDGGEAGYTEQPEHPLGDQAMFTDLSDTFEPAQDPWLAEEMAAVEHRAAPVQISESGGLDQDSVAVTPTLNTAHTGYYDEDTGEWVDDPTVTTMSAAHRLAEDTEFQQYYQEKLRGVNSTQVTFRSGVAIQPEPGIAPAVLEQLTPLQDSAPSDIYYLIQFSYPFPAEAHQRLEAAGVTFYDHVGTTGFYAKVPPEAMGVLQALTAESLVRHVGEIPLAAKVEPDLLVEAAAGSSAEHKVTVLTFEEPTPAQLQELESFLKIDCRSSGPVHILEGTIPASSIQALAGLRYVRWVEKQPANVLHNLDGGMGIGGDVVRKTGQDGTDVHVMVVDTGIARSGGTYHPDLPASRILDQYDYQNSDNNAADDNSHGTHVAGTTGGRYDSGDANSNRSWQGMAPDVDFYIYKLCCGANQFSSAWFQSSFQRATSGGRTTHISQNSWGSSIAGTYNTNSEIVDRAVRGEYNNQHINVVVSSGNANDLTSAPATGKNVVAVGNVKDGSLNYSGWPAVCPSSDTTWPPGVRWCSSSYGPIDTDGDSRTRVKPDVVAPGTRIRSAAPWYLAGFDYYADKGGTSMAAPHVSGGIAQILDSYSGSSSWLWSWPETVKALLLATTVDVGGNTDFYGHGQVNPFHAIWTQSGISSAAFWSSTINPGETKDFTFEVPSGYQELRIVLTWSDPAGSTEVNHDLDIWSVKDPGGTERGSSSSYDDTVEYVKIPGGYGAGTWTVSVYAFSASTSQRLGLAVHRVLADANLHISPWVKYVPSSTGSVDSGDSFYLHQYISNFGFPGGGSYARLYVPTGFTVQGVRIYTADGHSHWYDDSEIYHPAGSSYWRVAVGEVMTGYPRHVRWFIRADSSTADGHYTFESVPYWREGGVLQTGTGKSTVVSVGEPSFTSPIDVYLLVDLTGSFADDLPIFKAQAPAIVSTLLAVNPNTRFGLGRFEDYPISPFGSAADGDGAYERVVDLTFDTTTVLNEISGLSVRYGSDNPESQLVALYQAATGAGQNLTGAGYPGASIPPGQQANLRDGATKLFLLWTDATFHLPGDPGDIPYPGPSVNQTVNAILALDPPKVMGISSGGGGISDLEEVAAATGALAPVGGIDCDDDGTIDVAPGQPLVCSIVSSGEGIAEAVVALIKGGAEPAAHTVHLPIILRN
jgi:subtilisin family serine protease